MRTIYSSVQVYFMVKQCFITRFVTVPASNIQHEYNSIKWVYPGFSNSSEFFHFTIQRVYDFAHALNGFQS